MFLLAWPISSRASPSANSIGARLDQFGRQHIEQWKRIRVTKHQAGGNQDETEGCLGPHRKEKQVTQQKQPPSARTTYTMHRTPNGTVSTAMQIHVWATGNERWRDWGPEVSPREFYRWCWAAHEERRHVGPSLARRAGANQRDPSHQSIHIIMCTMRGSHTSHIKLCENRVLYTAKVHSRERSYL
jgi:hypothetical protein